MSALLLCSIFTWHYFLLMPVHAKDVNVESLLNRLDSLEAKLKENTDARKDVDYLTQLVNEQKHALKNSEEKILILEKMLQGELMGKPTFVKPRSVNTRATLKIEPGSKVQDSHDDTIRSKSGPLAFMAYMKRFHTSDQYPPGSILPFELATLNYGNAYNKSSGLFTCPSSGVYKLDWALAYYTPNDTSSISSSGLDNVSNTGNDAVRLSGTGHVSDGREYTVDVDFVIVHLNKSDTAGVTNPDDGGVFMPYFSKFSGFKVSD